MERMQAALVKSWGDRSEVNGLNEDTCLGGKDLVVLPTT